MHDLGDFIPGAVIDFTFNTRDTDGVPITLAGSPSMSVYKDNDTSPDTGDITLTVGFNSTTGLHHVRIDTGPDPTFYATGHKFHVVIGAGTVDGISVVGVGVAYFTLGMQTVAQLYTVGPQPTLGWDESGTMRSGSTSTVAKLRSATSFADDLINNSFLQLTAGTGKGQKRFITNWDSAADEATVDPPFDITPDDTTGYAVVGVPPGTTDAPIPATLDPTEWASIAGAVRTELTTELSLVDASISSRASDTDLDALQTSVNTIDDLLDTEISALITAVDALPTNAELATALAAADDAVLAAIAALNNLSAAQVNAEVVDALNVDTYAQPGAGAPAATVTLRAAIGYLYKWARNKKTNDGTETKFYNDDASTVDHEQDTTESGGTVTKSEIRAPS